MFFVSMRNGTSDLRIPRSDALPLSHKDSTMSEVYYEVHLTRILHTARISSVMGGVMFVDGMIGEMVSLKKKTSSWVCSLVDRTMR